LTKHLPPAYEGVIEYVERKGRTKIAVKGQISDYMAKYLCLSSGWDSYFARL
jgi:hypothetical protein